MAMTKENMIEDLLFTAAMKADLPKPNGLLNTNTITASLNLKSYDKDHRQYQYLELQNGLKVLLIEDNRAKYATSTLYLKVGHKDDPLEHPGLIHFLEHMVFMGSEEFPDEKEFEEFITRNSGYRNGITYTDYTEFPLGIVHEKFEEALKRFVAFIKFPLLKPNCAKREVKAVHEEFMGNLTNDSRREFYVSTLLMNPKHPNHRYFAGNEESLKDLGSIFPKLKSLHQEHYVADRMTLILRSKHSLKELKNLAIKYFSNIRKSERNENVISEPTYTPSELGNKVYMQSAQKNNYIKLSFVINGRRSMALIQAFGYIQYLLNNPQKGGLSDTLKRRGLIQDNWHTGDFSASLDMIDEFQFAITVYGPLTMEGIKRIDEITVIVLTYFDFLRRQGIQIQYFKEFQEDNARYLRFQADTHEPNFFENLKYYDLKYFFRGTMILEDSVFSVELVDEILSKISPKNMRQIIVLDAPEQDASWKIEPRTITKDIQIKYKVTALSSLVISWNRDCKEALDIPFKLPEGSEFFPNDFRVKPQSENFRVPRLIFHQNGVTVWYSQDLHFKQPTISTRCYLISHLARDSTFNAACTSVFVLMIASELTRHLAESLRRADVKLYIDINERGLTISFSGFSDKHDIMISKVFDLMMSFEIDSDEFISCQRSVVESCEAKKTNKPIKQCQQSIDLLLTFFSYSSDDFLKEFEKMTIQDLKGHMKELFKSFMLEIHCHGNLLPKEAIEIAKHVAKKLNVGTNSNYNHYCPPQGMIVKLPEGSNFHFVKKVEHVNRAVVVFFQAPDNTRKTNAKLRMIEKLVKSSFYQQLRTVEQLGYDVDCSIEDIEDYNGIMFHVESSKYSAGYLLKRIELFIRVFEKVLDDFTEERFVESSNSQQTLIERYLTAPSSGDQYASLFAFRFENNEYRFKEVFEVLEHYKAIDLAMIKEFYKELTQPCSMRKLVVMTDDDVSFKSTGKSDAEETMDDEEVGNGGDNLTETEKHSSALDISKYYLELRPDSECMEGQIVPDILWLKKRLPCFPDYMDKGRAYLESIIEFNSLRSEQLNSEEGFVEVAPGELFQTLQEVGLVKQDECFSNGPSPSADLALGNEHVSDVILSYCFDSYRSHKKSMEPTKHDLATKPPV